MKLLFLVFLFILYPLTAFSAIDERKIDVYFANGIKTNEGNASANTDLLRLVIVSETYNGNLNNFDKSIGDVTEAYNSTHNMFADEDGGFDLLESFYQLTNYQEYYDAWVSNMSHRMIRTAHDRDLDTQVKAYKESIKSGHKVLVVAHSQGNLFTYEAYRRLDGWMQDYFEAVSVASPRHDLIKEGTPRISWHNDLVAHIGLYDDFVTNPVRVTKWVSLDGSRTPPFESPMHTYDFQVPTGVFDGWVHIDFRYDSNVHAFSFYMGEELKREGSALILNTFTHDTLRTDDAKDKILFEIGRKITLLESRSSQWNIRQIIGCGCNTRAILTHIEPTAHLNNLVADIHPMLFHGSGKLYKPMTKPTPPCIGSRETPTALQS